MNLNVPALQALPIRQPKIKGLGQLMLTLLLLLLRLVILLLLLWQLLNEQDLGGVLVGLGQVLDVDDGDCVGVVKPLVACLMGRHEAQQAGQVEAVLCPRRLSLRCGGQSVLVLSRMLKGCPEAGWYLVGTVQPFLLLLLLGACGRFANVDDLVAGAVGGLEVVLWEEAV